MPMYLTSPQKSIYEGYTKNPFYSDAGTNATSYVVGTDNSAYDSTETAGTIYGSAVKKYITNGRALSGAATRFLYDVTNGTIINNTVNDEYVTTFHDITSTYGVSPTNYVLSDLLNVTGIYNGYDGVWSGVMSEADKKRNSIRANLCISVISRATPLSIASAAERVALDTLREMISESDYRKYLKYGFLMVTGSSGDTFQIFRDKHHTKVWRDGKVIEEICVRIKDTSIPPTDNVIAFKTLIEIDDGHFRSMGNRFPMGELSIANNQAAYRIAA